MKITGLNNVLRILDKLDITDEVHNILDKGGDDILNTAKSNVDDTDISSSLVKVSRDENGAYIINIGTDLVTGAYYEYGTGENVFIIKNGAGAFTSDDKDYAHEFYVNGKGYKYARPYLSPAYYSGRAKIAQEIERLVNSVVR